FLVGDDVDPAAAVFHRLQRRAPRGGVADLDRCRNRAWLFDDAILVHRRRPRGLEADHARQAVDLAVAVVLAIAAPVRRDVARVADGDQVIVGRATELIHDLERAGLLPFETEGVHVVHHGYRMRLRDT